MRLRKRHVVLGAALLLAVAAVVYVWRFTPFVARQVSEAFTKNLLHERGYRLEVARVRADPFGRVVFTEPRLVAERQPPVVVAEARELRVRVGILALMRGAIDIESLVLDEPRVRTGTRGIQADILRSTGPRRSALPDIDVGTLQVRHGWFENSTDSTRSEVDSIDVRLRLEADARGVHVDLTSATASLPSHGVTLREARGQMWWRDDSLRVTGARIVTDSSAVDVEGWLARSGRALWLHGTATPLHLGDVERFLALPASGRLLGAFEVARQDSNVSFGGRWSGGLAGMQFSDVDLDVSASPRLVHVKRAAGRFGTSPFELGLRWQAGALHGDLHFEQLDLRSVPQSGVELPTRLRGEARFTRSTRRDSLYVDVGLQAGQFGDWSIESASGRVAILGADFAVHDADVRLPGARVRARGGSDAGELLIAWTAEGEQLHTVLAPLGVRFDRFGGSAEGTTLGPLRATVTNASGRVHDVGVAGAGAANADVEVTWNAAPPGSGVVEIRADAVKLGQRRFETLSSRLEVAGGVIDVQRAQLSAGDTLIACAARVQQLPRDWLDDPRPTTRIDLETALLQLGPQEVRVEEPATLWYRPGAWRAEGWRLVTREGRLRLDGDLDLERSRIDARAEVQEFDLAFIERFSTPRHRVTGTATGWFEAHGDLDRTQVDARLSIERGRWNSLPFDSVRVDLQSDAFGTELRTVECATPHGSFRAQGRLGWLPSLRRWTTGEVRGSLAELEASAVQLACVVRDLEVERVWAARSVTSVEPDWSGRVSARLQVDGQVGAPRLALHGEAHELHLPQANAESVTFNVEFADGSLRVPQLEVRMAGATILADGALPARLSLASGGRLLREQPFEAHLRVPQSSFALVQQLIPLFEPAPQSVPAGLVEATLDVSGTLASPDARGQMRVSGAGFTLKGMEEIYRDVDAEGVFAADSLRITSVRGRSGDGRISGNGTVYFDGFRLRDYRISLQAEAIPVHSVPQMVAEVSGGVNMRAVTVSGGALVPEFRGALRVHEALITQEFAGGGDAGVLESTDMPEWLADVTLDAPGKVWIKNSQADVELEGSVRVVRSTAGMDVSGRANIRRGNYSLYLERFEITRGELDFSRNPGFQPELDIEARQGPPGNRIYVYLTGRPPDALRWSLSSDRGDTSDELQQILFAGVRNDPFNVTSTVVERIVQDLQFIESFSIDQAAVDSTSTSSLPFNISAGKAVSDRVFIIYTLGVNESDIRDRVALEVDVVRGVLLATSYERRNIPDYQPNRPQNAFDVDLKFRWEY